MSWGPMSLKVPQNPLEGDTEMPPSWMQQSPDLPAGYKLLPCQIIQQREDDLWPEQSSAPPSLWCGAVRCISSTLSWTATSSAGDMLSWEPWGLENGFWKGQWVEPGGLHRGEPERMLLWRQLWLKQSRKHRSNLVDFLSVTETEGKGRRHKRRKPCQGPHAQAAFWPDTTRSRFESF